MAKLRLLVWTVATGVAALVLLRGLTWSDQPEVAAMTVVRVVAGMLAASLCGATVLAVRLPRLAPRFVRRLVATAIGTGLLVVPVPATASTSDDPSIEAPILRRVSEPEPEPRSRYRSAPEVPRSGPENEGGTVVVAPGDHLWSIAEKALSERLGRPASDDEVVPFWTALIDLNRDQLPDPDLIFAGQVFRLPS